MVMTNGKSAAERLLGEMLPNTNGRSAAERKAMDTQSEADWKCERRLQRKQPISTIPKKKKAKMKHWKQTNKKIAQEADKQTHAARDSTFQEDPPVVVESSRLQEHLREVLRARRLQLATLDAGDLSALGDNNRISWSYEWCRSMWILQISSIAFQRVFTFKNRLRYSRERGVQNLLTT